MEKCYTWEEAVDLIRRDPKNKELIYNSYLSIDIQENCNRFYSSQEFSEVSKIIKNLYPDAKSILDIAAGNGIASFSFAKSGYNVVSLEPDPSSLVGRGAIEYIKEKNNLRNIQVIDAFGESIPIDDGEFDVVYVRQALHHASDLNQMLKEINRVLKPGGILIATREHIIDNYKEGLKEFLNGHEIHQLYGGEYAYTHKDYLKAIKSNNFKDIRTYKNYDSIINLFPNSFDMIKTKIRNTLIGRLLGNFVSEDLLFKIAIFILNRKRYQGRLYSFVARKY
jgi:ubiquinone/menaquinone biosynthesis C-methylase UbiE